MLTKTLSQEDSQNIELNSKISNTVNERGFYLYEWISSDELRITLESDYISAVQLASIPLAVVTIIAGFIGFGGGILGIIIGVLSVLGIFYGLLGIYLFIKFLHRSYLYTRGASVVITDNHFASGGNIIEQSDNEKIREQFRKFEEVFDEPFLGESKLQEKKEKKKTELFEKLKEIAFGGGRILSNIGGSRNSGGVAIVVLISGLLYAAMMGAIYIIGILFISFFGRLFSGLAHWYLLLTNNTEHKIQTLFSRIDAASELLENEKVSAIQLLDQAGQNLWKDNLTEKINTSTKMLSTIAGGATTDVIKLREILEDSKYKDIFNFQKYGTWAKNQILEPIDSILELLKRNQELIKSISLELENQISSIKNPSLGKPIFVQKERLDMQWKDFESVRKLLEGYRQKLN